MIRGRRVEALKRDIAKQGILVQITLYEGRILDGRNRYKAGKEVGHNFVAANFKEFVGTMAEAESYVISANIQRRQMTNAQKQDFIRLMIGKYPAWSNRQIGRLCQLSHERWGRLEIRSQGRLRS